MTRQFLGLPVAAIAMLLVVSGCAAGATPDTSAVAGPSISATPTAVAANAATIPRPDPLGTWQNKAYPDFSLTLADDGQADVQLGCNRGHLQWGLTESGAIVFNGLMATEVGCDTGLPDDVVLSGATLIDSRTLALLDADGAPAFELTRQD